MAEPVLAGHCLCGAVTVTVAGAHDPRPGACHCRMCQRWSGGIFMCFEASVEAVTVTGAVTRYASSDFSERAFCPRCGSHLWSMRSEIYTDRAIARLRGDHPTATRAQYEAKNKFVKGDAL